MELRHLRYFRAQLEGVARSAQICLDVLDILGGNGPAAGNYIARHRRACLTLAVLRTAPDTRTRFASSRLSGKAKRKRPRN